MAIRGDATGGVGLAEDLILRDKGFQFGRSFDTNNVLRFVHGIEHS